MTTAEQIAAAREAHESARAAKRTDYLIRQTAEDLRLLLDEARMELNCEHDPYVLRSWELQFAELQRELAIRNKRQTSALESCTISDEDRDDLAYLVGWCNASFCDVTVECDRLRRAVAALDRLLGGVPC